MKFYSGVTSMKMGITLREAWSIIHGVGFGTAFLILFPAVLLGLFFLGRGWVDGKVPGSYVRFLVVGAWTITVLAWLTDIVGSYVPYPWYRVQPPEGITNLRNFPKSYLRSRSHLAVWENFGMKWKEYLGWVVPILSTAASYILLVYGKRLIDQPKLRKAVMTLFLIAFITGGITGLLGIFITKLAPVR